MKRKFLLTLFLGLFLGMVAFAQQTSIQGKVSDGETGETLIGATVVVFKEGVQLTGTTTDFDGNYKLNVDPGNYSVEFSYVGFSPQRIEGIQVIEGRDNVVDAVLESSAVTAPEVVVTTYKKPLVEQDNTTQGGVKTADEIRQLPTRNIGGLVATTAGLSSVDNGAASVRGSRPNSTYYYIDGIRVFGNLLPESEIEQLQVITGGVSAQYGDVTGGVISITTRGPSSQFRGTIEAESSGVGNDDSYVGLDQFGSSLVGLSLSGPILKNDKGISLLGYRLAGRYTYRRDNSAGAFGNYIVKPDVLSELQANPLILNEDGVPEVNAESLRSEDVELINYTPNERQRRIDLTAKLDARLSDEVDVAFTGTYTDNNDFSNPGRFWTLLNNDRNPVSQGRTFRGNFRLRHRVGSSNGSAPGESAEGLIRNFEYILQVGYERNQGESYDRIHEDRLFDYGHIGQFDLRFIPTFSNDTTRFDHLNLFLNNSTGDIGFVGHSGYTNLAFINANGYVPSDKNPILANYNNVLTPLLDLITDDNGSFRFFDDDGNLIGNSNWLLENFLTYNGFVRGDLAQPWQLYNNVGTISNGYSKNESEVITGNVKLNFDLVPGQSDNSRHSIAMGFTYEERISRGFSSSPRALWQLMRQVQNEHIIGTDFNTILRTIPLNATSLANYDWTVRGGLIGLGVTDAVFTNQLLNASFFDANGNPLTDLPIYAPLIDPTIGNPNAPGNLFYQSIRDRLGLQLTDFVNIDGLDPNIFGSGLDALGLFAPIELTDFGLASFTGYTHTGERVSTDVTFDDFFTGVSEYRDAEGNILTYRSFEVAPLRPIYIAGYIEDKLKFKDAFLRLGLRVDRYDANRQVMRDPYSIYEIINANDYYNLSEVEQERPGTVRDNWKVYVESSEAENPTVKAFRDGDQWYDANGAVVNDPRLIFGQGGLVNPFYANRSNTNIQQFGFDPTTSFEDYTPQTNFMPRLAFSFPISDLANFFAHYDVLVERPTSGDVFTPLNFFYFNFVDRNNPIGNPNLLPQKTISYEIGFQQRLSNSSAIKFAAYYRELRDMITSRLFQFLPSDQASEYQTFSNQDFGTVKGFTFEYDLRRTGNLRLNINYTLQFADGTGSNPTSNSAALFQIGQVRTLFPLDYDQRHSINVIMDYRYRSGRAYNGPRIGGVDILANTGLNMQVVTNSGRPYTRTQVPLSFQGDRVDGTFNGSRLPWNYRVDARLDKDFKLGTYGNGRPINLNLYIRAENLFDTRNVVGVWTATGSADDDGFLQSALGQQQLSTITLQGRDVEAYLDAYDWALLINGYYTLPRRMWLGAIVQF